MNFLYVLLLLVALCDPLFTYVGISLGAVEMNRYFTYFNWLFAVGFGIGYAELLKSKPTYQKGFLLCWILFLMLPVANNLYIISTLL